MISKELLPENDRQNLEAEKWLLNTEFNQAKYFNEIGHQFFKEGRYKKYSKATQLDVTKRIIFILEALEQEHNSTLEKVKELEERIAELEEERVE